MSINPFQTARGPTAGLQAHLKACPTLGCRGAETTGGDHKVAKGHRHPQNGTKSPYSLLIERDERQRLKWPFADYQGSKGREER